MKLVPDIAIVVLDERREAARLVDAYFREDAQREQHGWVTRGRYAQRVRDEELFRYLNKRTEDGRFSNEPYHSWNAYMQELYGRSQSSIYRDLQLIDRLGSVADIELTSIPVGHALDLLSLSANDCVDPDWITKAQTMRRDDFWDLICESLEGAAQPESHRTIKFAAVTKSFEQQINKALQLAEWLDPTDNNTRNSQLEFILAEFLNAPWDQNSSLSNEQAYEHARLTTTLK